MTKKVKIVLLIVLIFLIGLAVPSYSWTRKNIDQIAKFYNARMSPIIMIPGSSATENRFDGLVQKLRSGMTDELHIADLSQRMIMSQLL